MNSVLMAGEGAALYGESKGGGGHICYVHGRVVKKQRGSKGGGNRKHDYTML